VPILCIYDLRVAYSHLGTGAGQEARISSVTERLDLNDGAPLIEIYEALTDQIDSAFSQLTQVLNPNAL